METIVSDPMAIIRRVYELEAASDLAGLTTLIDPDVTIHQDPALPWGGTHRGHEGVAAFIGALRTAIDSTVETERLYQAGEKVVQIGRTRGTVRSSGASFDVPECHVWTVRDGKVVHAEFMIDSGAMLEALGS